MFSALNVQAFDEKTFANSLPFVKERKFTRL